MALVVEDGTGLANADSYISVADADAYHAAVGRESSWTDKDEDTKEFELRKATRYLLQFYSLHWKGARVSSTQRLCWPRTGAVVYGFEVASDQVPQDVKFACAELAFKSINGTELAPDLKPRKKRTKVGPIETEFFENTVQSVIYREVGGMLKPYINGAGGKLIRD